jgi:microcystin-dependent protein
MPRVFATDIVEASSTLGVSTYSLDGPRIGYRSFNEGYNTGDTPYYVVRNAADTKYEHNRKGTYTTGTPDTLSRNVLYSSNGNAPVAWVTGDLPLLVYVPSAIEMLEQVISGWKTEVRDNYLTFGHWFDSSIPGKAIWKIFDGVSDITVGTVDLATHTMILRDFPAGVVQMYAGDTAPTGFLFCRGQFVSKLIYAELYSKITNRYGDGGATFRIPNLQGRLIAGLCTDTFPIDRAERATLGGVWGRQYHTHGGSASITSVSVSGSCNIASISVSGSISVYGETGNGSASAGGGSGAGNNFLAGNYGITSTGNNSMSGGAHGGTSAGTGTGSGSIAADNQDLLPPTFVLNYIISTGGV